MASYEKEYASRASRPPAQIFMCLGELEGPKVAELDDFAGHVARHLEGMVKSKEERASIKNAYLDDGQVRNVLRTGLKSIGIECEE